VLNYCCLIYTLSANGKILKNDPGSMKTAEIGMKAMGISLAPYSTYKQSFNFRSIVTSGDII